MIFRQKHEPGHRGFSDFTRARVVLGGESLAALAEGLQSALRHLGGALREHRADSLSAAFPNLCRDAVEDLTERYRTLCDHYGMTASRNNRGVARERGDRGVARPSRARRRREGAPAELAGDARRRLRGDQRPGHLVLVFYTVPPRLIGHRLGVRVHDDRLELFLSGTHHLAVPRGRAGGTGRAHVVNHRHVIHSLKKKPLALANLVYRDALFPRSAYRRCFEAALERLGEHKACRLTVGLFALAHEENREAELAAEIDDILDEGRLPDPAGLKARFAPDPARMPRIDVATPPLAGYGALLGAGGAS